jgi:glycerol-3-phosphate dehydrogenase (NAD(P)+)
VANGSVVRFGVVSAGAWGTALAETVCRGGSDVILWAKEEEVVQSINEERRNHSFLPNMPINRQIFATNNINDLAHVDLILLVTPAQHLRSICSRLSVFLANSIPLVICSKGIEVGSNTLMPEVVGQELSGSQLLILSGPTFAREVASGLPTAVTLACADQALGKRVCEIIGTPEFRPYLSNDVRGSAIGGAVKNVLAIACGLVEGKSLGDNARASILTRGLAEVGRLAVCMGGQPQTLMGLSGLGDLLLTASSMQSRNFSLGFALGQGNSLDSILAQRISVTEGVLTSKAVVALALEKGVEMPICTSISKILEQTVSVDNVISELLDRPFTEELTFA